VLRYGVFSEWAWNKHSTLFPFRARLRDTCAGPRRVNNDFQGNKKKKSVNVLVFFVRHTKKTVQGETIKRKKGAFDLLRRRLGASRLSGVGCFSGERERESVAVGCGHVRSGSDVRHRSNYTTRGNFVDAVCRPEETINLYNLVLP